MKVRISNFWESLRSSYWFLPALMAGAAVVFSFVMIALDQRVQYRSVMGLGWIYTGQSSGARAILSTVAGSMITVAGVTFSITIVALSLASSQFGPRLLNNFMRDLGNQVVLGTFVSTFIYCLLVLRSIRDTEAIVFVPHLSVTFGVLLAMASLGVFIYFIHHASVSIHADNVIATVERDLNRAIERLFPDKHSYQIFEEKLREEDDIPENFDQQAQPVAAASGGYVQTIDQERLMTLATKHDLILRLEYRAGDFAPEETTLVLVWPGNSLDEALTEEIRETFILGVQRLRLQDVEFALKQLVEIAVRALSPGINDPFTAITCLDRLGAALSQLAGRDIPSACRYDEQDNLRLITDSVTFSGLTDTAFNQIRQYGRSNVEVVIRMLETIAVIGEHTHSKQDRDALMRHAAMIKRGSDEVVPEERDRKDIQNQYEVAVRVLKERYA